MSFFSHLTNGPAKEPTWNEAAILEKGMAFLNQKNEELNIAHVLWHEAMVDTDASVNTIDVNLPAAILAGKKFNTMVAKNRKEVKELIFDIKNILKSQSKSELLSFKTQQLSKIAIVAQRGIAYFNRLGVDTYDLDAFNCKVNNSLGNSFLLSSSALALSVISILFAEVIRYPLPSMVYTIGKISGTMLASTIAASYLDHVFRVLPAEQKAEQKFDKLKQHFETALLINLSHEKTAVQTA